MVAIITGCSRGIGFEIAKRLSEKHKVFATSTSGIIPISSSNITKIKLRLERIGEIDHFVRKMKRDRIRVDLLVNNAAILIDSKNSFQINTKNLIKTLQVNLVGTIHLTESLLPVMRKNGCIINLSSGWGTFSNTKFDCYNSCYKLSKCALNMYTKILSQRLSKRNICVSAIDPGWVKTGMGGNKAKKEPNEVVEEVEYLWTNNIISGHLWKDKKIASW